MVVVAHRIQITLDNSIKYMKGLNATVCTQKYARLVMDGKSIPHIYGIWMKSKFRRPRLPKMTRKRWWKIKKRNQRVPPKMTRKRWKII